VPARRRPREQQVGDVRARDQQHERDDDHDRGERLLITPPQSRVARCGGREGERLLQVCCLVLLAIRIGKRGVADLRLQRAQRGRRGLERLSRLPSHHDAQPPVRAAIERALAAANQRFGAERNGDVELPADFGTEELRRRDADDGVSHALDGQRLADRIGRAREAPLPEPVADHRDRSVGAAAPPVVVRSKRSAEDRRHAEDVEIRAARPDPVHHFRLAALRQVEPRRRPGQRSSERLLPVAKRFPQRVRPRGRRRRVALRHHHQLLRTPDRERPQHQAVEDGEDCRVGADAEREREDGDRRNDRRGRERAERVSKVLHGSFDGGRRFRVGLMIRSTFFLRRRAEALLQVHL
jgi:hypothetical protein